MADPEHLARLVEGVETWNDWRRQAQRVWPDLSYTDLRGLIGLRGANLHRVDFRGSDLSGVDLCGTDLTDADFRGARLRGVIAKTALSRANLGSADLEGSDLQQANLQSALCYQASFVMADLRGANLRGVNFQNAGLMQANLTSASFGSTVFGSTNLARAQGLETCKHDGPSILDLNTLLLSPSLPLVFLQGCGLPDHLIAYLPSLLNQPIQFYSCFISYSTKDQEFADRLHSDLQNRGVRCWFAPHDIQAGKKIHEQIDQAIRLYDRLLLILSEHSMNSEWVKTEIAHARQKEVNEGRQVLPSVPTLMRQFSWS